MSRRARRRRGGRARAAAADVAAERRPGVRRRRGGASPTWPTPPRSTRSPRGRSSASVPSTSCATTPASSRSGRRGSSRSTTGAGCSTSTCGASSTASAPSSRSCCARASPGHVVNTASIAGLVPSPTIAPYNVAKAGVVADLRDPRHGVARARGPDRGVGAVPRRRADADRRERAQPTGGPDGGQEPARPPDPARPAADGAAPPSRSPTAWSTPSATTRFWIVTHEGSVDLIAQRCRRDHRRRPTRGPAGVLTDDDTPAKGTR